MTSPACLEPLEVHVDERAAEADLARQRAHVDPAGRDGGQDAHAVGVRERCEHAHELIAITGCHVSEESYI